MRKQSRQVIAGVGQVEAALMIDSAPLLQAGQIDTAKERLAKDGYLLLQNYLSAERLSEVLSSSPLLVLTVSISIEVKLLFCRHARFCWMSYIAGNLNAARLRYVSAQYNKWRRPHSVCHLQHSTCANRMCMLDTTQ